LLGGSLCGCQGRLTRTIDQATHRQKSGKIMDTQSLVAALDIRQKEFEAKTTSQIQEVFQELTTSLFQELFQKLQSSLAAEKGQLASNGETSSGTISEGQLSSNKKVLELESGQKEVLRRVEVAERRQEALGRQMRRLASQNQQGDADVALREQSRDSMGDDGTNLQLRCNSREYDSVQRHIALEKQISQLRLELADHRVQQQTRIEQVESSMSNGFHGDAKAPHIAGTMAFEYLRKNQADELDIATPSCTKSPTKAGEYLRKVRQAEGAEDVLVATGSRSATTAPTAELNSSRREVLFAVEDVQVRPAGAEVPPSSEPSQALITARAEQGLVRQIITAELDREVAKISRRFQLLETEIQGKIQERVRIEMQREHMPLTSDITILRREINQLKLDPSSTAASPQQLLSAFQEQDSKLACLEQRMNNITGGTSHSTAPLSPSIACGGLSARLASPSISTIMSPSPGRGFFSQNLPEPPSSSQSKSSPTFKSEELRKYFEKKNGSSPQSDVNSARGESRLPHDFFGVCREAPLEDEFILVADTDRFNSLAPLLFSESTDV